METEILEEENKSENEEEIESETQENEGNKLRISREGRD